MHKGHFHKNGREVDIYDSFDEVAAISPRAPRYCGKCGKELTYGSFLDSAGRFTLKGYCKVCKTDFAAPLTTEGYEAQMLRHWTDLVKQRAGHRCEMESEKCAGELHAHHIIPKAMDPSKMYDVENGLCLCAAHHKMIHHYM